MNKKNIQRNKGITLLEVLLYVVLAVIILGVIASFMITFLSTSVKSEVIRSVNEQGSFAMDSMTKDIRAADAITSPTASSTATTLSIVIGATTTTYSLNNGILEKTTGSTTQQITNSDSLVSNLQFKNDSRSGSEGVVRIQFNVSANADTGRFEYNYSEKFINAASLYIQN